MSNITQAVKQRIQDKQRGWVFTPKDFADLGSRAAIDQVLSRLVKQDMIRRLDRGVYDFPKQHPMLGLLSPNADDLAQAIGAQTGDVIFPSGAIAANMLGLSTQVPAKASYVTNGKSRTKTIAGRTISLKHARVPIMQRLSDKVNYILQALYYIGKQHVDDKIIISCASKLNDQDMKDLALAISRTPGWLSDIILKIQKAKDGQLPYPT